MSKMLHKSSEVLDETVYSMSSDLKDCDSDFQEQGYLWLCSACEHQPTFETIYDLFHHKKTHDVGIDKSVNSKPVKTKFTDSTDCVDTSCIEESELLSTRVELEKLDENETDAPFLVSPTPSCSSEDIPLANLLLDNFQAEHSGSKPSKKSKRNGKKVKLKSFPKLKSDKSKTTNKEAKMKDETGNDSDIKAKTLASDDKFNDLKDSKEEKENAETSFDNHITDENETETDSVENSKQEKEDSKSKIRHFCKICNTEFPSRFALSAHKKTHLFEDTGCYKCETCGKMCPKYDNFTRHLTIHFTNRQKNHHCTQCFASFYNYADLKRHQVLHLAVKPYKCEHCGEGFIRQDSLLIHEYKHTGIQYKKFACKDCDKVLNSPSALVMHAKTHSEKTVFCPEPGCKFSCYLQSQLRQHIKRHSGEKPFQCAKCGRCFARNNDMKNHNLNVHEGIKPFKCSSCPKKFALIGNLKNHKITHTNERPFLCAQCGKSFNQSSTLRKHSLIMHGPCKAGGRQKKSKKMSPVSCSKGSEEPKRPKGKFRELPDNQIKRGKNKDRKGNDGEGLIKTKIEKSEPEEYVMPSSTNLATVGSSVVQEVPREAQIQVPQITVRLPIQLDNSVGPQTFILPTFIIETGLLRTDNYIKETS